MKKNCQPVGSGPPVEIQMDQNQIAQMQQDLQAASNVVLPDDDDDDL